MSSPRILIVRLRAIGDTIQTMPVACALRERYPGAFLAWAVEERGGGPAARASGPERTDRTAPRLAEVARRRVAAAAEAPPPAVRHHHRRAKPDPLGESGAVFRARRRIGFGSPWGRELSKWLNNGASIPRPRTSWTAISNCCGRWASSRRQCGSKCPNMRRTGRPRRPWSPGVDGGFAIINPGAGWPSKLWPAARYAAVARHLSEVWHLPSLVVWGSPAEKTLAERLPTGGGRAMRPRPRR